MKRILITGKDSYIGRSVERWLDAYGGGGGEPLYSVTVLDVRGEGWREFDFGGFDTVFHVAGIAHIKESKKNRRMYYAVNRDLAVEVAQKAKANNVRQFILMSSMSLYDGYNTMLRRQSIDRETPLMPESCYGDSKRQADEAVQRLQSDSFNVAVLRPPMVYGPGCKGNFPRLARLAEKTFIFPKINNERSMLHIDNLCEFIRLVIDNGSKGVFFPQNKDYLSSAEIVCVIARRARKKVWFTRLLNPLIYAAAPFLPPLKKLFGNLAYAKEISNDFGGQYRVCGAFRNIGKGDAEA